MRAQTVVGHARTSKEYDGKPYGKGMFYTADDVREVLRYAADRYIDVIPEIEMPGHALPRWPPIPDWDAAEKGYAVSPTWASSTTFFCAGNDRVFEFMEGVLDEVIALFPSGVYPTSAVTRCPKTRWKECPVCQKRIAEEGLEDEHELQSYFMKRIERFVNSRGRRIIGWREILEGGVSPTATVMSWKSPQAGIRSRQAGATRSSWCPRSSTISTTTSRRTRSAEPFAIGGYVPRFRVYGYDPTISSMPGSARRFWACRPTSGRSTSPPCRMSSTWCCRAWPQWRERVVVRPQRTTTISCGACSRCAGSTTCADSTMRSIFFIQKLRTLILVKFYLTMKHVLKKALWVLGCRNLRHAQEVAAMTRPETVAPPVVSFP